MIPSRRLLSSLNLLTTLVLLGVLFIFVNFISSRRYARWDLSKQHITALSQQTVQTLSTLQEPLSIVVFYQPGHRLYELVKDLLTEYARVNPKLKVEYVDPEQDRARAIQLVQEFQITGTGPEALNLVIFKLGSRHKYLSDTELADYDYAGMGFGGQPRVKAFKGEEAFTSAIINLMQTQTSLVWLTKGHGEKSIEDSNDTGLSALKRLWDQQNVEAKEVTLLEQSTIPPEVTLVVIAGPTHRVTEQEVALLQSYLDQGGHLFALLDPLTDTGLDSLLERWGIRLGMDIVVDPAQQLPFVSAANVFVTTYTQHPIVEKMKTLMTLFPLARSVQAISPSPEGLTVTPLAFTSEKGWGETQTSVSTFEFDEHTDLKGPVSLAVASERRAAAPPEKGTAPPRTRLVVIGDSEFVMNAQLPNVGNRDLALGSIYWLLEQEQFIGIGPKPIESIKLNLTSQQLSHVFWFSFLAMPLFFGAIGTGVWWRRRT